ncbi:hypothetical protein AGMMS49546_39090 [Spirochaetia bacterium]|nr:hypothetical protein AGMMS49546_39090 [Spirochaetia bacterium]
MGMCKHLLKAILITALAPLLMIACGELETVLPSTGTYQVNALVGKSSLDVCSIINEKDTIRPFFSNSVANDPDLTGLTVFLQSSGGKIAGGKVQYTLSQTNSANNAGTQAGAKANNETNTVNTAKEEQKEADSGDDPEKETAAGASPQKAPAALPIGGSPDTLIPVARLDRDLPDFPLPKNLETGLYTMVFQVLGGKGILYRVDRPVYYIGGAEFKLDDIQSYLPASVGSHLVLPGQIIMLEAQITADEQLDPYIIWYNGKKRINEGSIAGGAGRFLWKAPDQTGFHTLRAEAFPFKPASNLKGTIRELSLPVSAKKEKADPLAKKAEQFAYWYQFSGDLRDSKTPAETARTITLRGNHPIRWLPAGSVYGLAVGPGDAYQIPLAPFNRLENDRTGGQLLLRFKPVSEGTVFTALFGRGNSLDMNLSIGDKKLILSLDADGQNVEIPLSLESMDNDTPVTVTIDFCFEANRFIAGLNLEKFGATISEVMSIPLSAALSGEGTFRLGGVRSVFGTSEKNEESPVTAIFDEFAASYQVTPLLNTETAAAERRITGGGGGVSPLTSD